MSIDQTDVVDFVSIEEASGRVFLTISDHLDWDKHEGEHLLMLQEKLNAYLRFIESGEIEQKFPHARGRPVTISIVAKYPLSREAKKFFGLAKDAIHEAGFALEFELLNDWSASRNEFESRAIQRRRSDGRLCRLIRPTS